MNLALVRLHSVLVRMLVLCLTGSSMQAARHPVGSATLQENIDSKGNVSLSFLLFTFFREYEDLVPLVSKTIGLKVKNVRWNNEDFKEVIAFNATFENPLALEGLRVHGAIDLGPIQKRMSELNVPQFTFMIRHPRAGFSRCTVGRQTTGPDEPITEYVYEARPDNVPLLGEIEYGYRTHDVLQTLLPLLGLALALVAAGRILRRVNPLLKLGRAGDYLSSFERFGSGRTFSIWIVWGVAIYLFRADLLGWFICGVGSESAKILCPMALIVLPVAGFSLLDPVLWWRQPLLSPAVVSTLRTQLMIIFPTLLLAVAIVAGRELQTLRATAWLLTAVVVSIALVASKLWASAEEPVPGQSEAKPSASSKRSNLMRLVWTQIGSILVVPAAGIFFVQMGRFDDTVQGLCYLAVLVVSVCVLLASRSVLTFLHGRGLPTGLLEIAQTSNGKLVPAPENGELPSRYARAICLLSPLGVVLLALWICQLMGFSFDTYADAEGWVFVFITLFGALFEAVRYWPRRSSSAVPVR